MIYSTTKWLCIAITFFCFGVALYSPDGEQTRDVESRPVVSLHMTTSGQSHFSNGRTLRTISIEQIRLGMRVLARNPEFAGVDIGQSDIQPELWRRLSLEMVKPDGGRLDIQLLRPVEWLQLHGKKSSSGAAMSFRETKPHLKDLVGKTINLDMPEMGASGPAMVVGISPCPTIEPMDDDLDRHVVTGTFRHSAANVVDLFTEDSPTPIGVTDNHLFWSPTYSAFLPVRQLNPGDSLQLAGGNVQRIAAIKPKVGRVPVFNLEVDAQHVYYVGWQGILVHNGYAIDDFVRYATKDEAADAISSGLVRPIPGTKNPKRIVDPLYSGNGMKTNPKKLSSKKHKYTEKIIIRGRDGLREWLEKNASDLKTTFGHDDSFEVPNHLMDEFNDLIKNVEFESI